MLDVMIKGCHLSADRVHFMCYTARTVHCKQPSHMLPYCAYTALPNWFYLFNNVCNFNVSSILVIFCIHIRNSHFLQLYTHKLFENTDSTPSYGSDT